MNLFGALILLLAPGVELIFVMYLKIHIGESLKENLEQVDEVCRRVEKSTQAPQPRSADGDFIIVVIFRSSNENGIIRNNTSP